MQTNTKTTTSSIEIPASIYRLAAQLEKDPETFASEILRAGIQAIDDGLGGNCTFDISPPYMFVGAASYEIRHDYTISGIIERMTTEELAAAREDASSIGLSVQELVRDRYSRGVNMELLQ